MEVNQRRCNGEGAEQNGLCQRSISDPVSNTAPPHCSMQNSLQQASPLHTKSSYVTFPGAVLGPNT